MEKIKKLKNYSDKNYSEIISFPVELVGRDGVVRRYSYEDSIRIYRRRIDSAHVRYQDREIINAEIYHCTRRMEQIQRSWGQRIRRSEQRYIDRRPNPDQRESYEKGKAFLQSYLADLVGDAELLPNLVLLNEMPPCRIFYVNHAGFRAGTLLYVFDFGEEEGSEGHRHFDEYLNLLLQVGSNAPDIEKLIHHEVHQNIGFILTNPNPDLLIQAPLIEHNHLGNHPSDDGGEGALNERFNFLGWIDSVLHDGHGHDNPVLREIMEAIGAGELELAYHRCKKATEESGYNRQAYWIMGALSEILGYWQETQSYLAMAQHYFPEDARIMLLVGLHELRLGEGQKAIKILENARKLRVDLPCLHALLVRGYISVQRHDKATWYLQEGLRYFPENEELLALEARFKVREKWYRQALIAGLVITVMAMAATYDTTSNAGWAVGLSVAGLVAVYYWYRHKSRGWQALLMGGT